MYIILYRDKLIKNDVAEVAEMAENRVLNDNLCHLCQCIFLLFFSIYVQASYGHVRYYCKMENIDCGCGAVSTRHP